MKVGIPVMKCSLNPSNTINKKTGKKSQTCPVDLAWQEMNDERIGRDMDINPDMTYRNVWMEGNSGDDVVQIVQAKIDEINRIKRENGKRVLRKDAVSVIEVIEKPNIEYMSELSYEEKVKFLKDSHETFKQLIHEWNLNWTLLESVQHHDEFGGLSAHNHNLILLTTVDDKGLPTMNAFKEVNLKFYSYINKNYPKMMRERGYEVEDVRTYDMLTDEEKMERKLNPQQHGVDSYTYKKRKKEEMEQELEKLKIRSEQMSSQLENTILEITKAPDLVSYKDIQDENQTLKKELSTKDKIIQKLNVEKKELKQSLEKWKRQCMHIANKIGNKMLNAIGLDTNVVGIKKELPSKEVIQVIDDTSHTIQYNANDLRVIPDSQNKGKFCVILKKDNGFDVVDNNFDNRQLAEYRIKEIIDLKIEINPIKVKMNMDS
ncbi:plasmid recombination protein [Holdemanella biformis]|uniref:plasmid recombination protein n=1 Tax=Holdemanella biformis TaxID=1735 RepID=UPI001C38D2D6|nr:plasmid recombination protein [Holdemanella biformis]MBV4132272.1 plasmid recombination protein [Holdemanella biformis]MBV4152037.1 plasmid recombination protein [Holdemanella biformis]